MRSLSQMSDLCGRYGQSGTNSSKSTVLAKESAADPLCRSNHILRADFHRLGGHSSIFKNIAMALLILSIILTY